MDIMMNDQEARVLGCLMEKAMATPEYYPLSLNALTNACNQKSNRDPVVDWDEQTVERTRWAAWKKSAWLTGARPAGYPSKRRFSPDSTIWWRPKPPGNVRDALSFLTSHQ